jgi:hypothetical protein
MSTVQERPLDHADARRDESKKVRLNGPRYRPEEVAYLRKHYGPWAPEPLPARVIAQKLGRSLESVGTAAGVRGLRKKRTPWTKDMDSALAAMHRQGFTERQMSRQLACSRSSVKLRLKKLGLAQPRIPAKHLIELRSNYRNMLGKHQCDNLHGLKMRQWKRKCAERGWPAASTLLECAVLDQLCQGSMDHPRLAQRIGRPPDASRFILARMEKKGLVRSWREGGFRVYALLPAAYAVPSQAA